jgi:hypothetical protein
MITLSHPYDFPPPAASSANANQPSKPGKYLTEAAEENDYDSDPLNRTRSDDESRDTTPSDAGFYGAAGGGGKNLKGSGLSGSGSTNKQGNKGGNSQNKNSSPYFEGQNKNSGPYNLSKREQKRLENLQRTKGYGGMLSERGWKRKEIERETGQEMSSMLYGGIGKGGMQIGTGTKHSGEVWNERLNQNVRRSQNVDFGRKQRYLPTNGYFAPPKREMDELREKEAANPQATAYNPVLGAMHMGAMNATNAKIMRTSISQTTTQTANIQLKGAAKLVNGELVENVMNSPDDNDPRKRLVDNLLSEEVGKNPALFQRTILSPKGAVMSVGHLLRGEVDARDFREWQDFQRAEEMRNKGRGGGGDGAGAEGSNAKKGAKRVSSGGRLEGSHNREANSKYANKSRKNHEPKHKDAMNKSRSAFQLNYDPERIPGLKRIKKKIMDKTVSVSGGDALEQDFRYHVEAEDQSAEMEQSGSEEQQPGFGEVLAPTHAPSGILSVNHNAFDRTPQKQGQKHEKAGKIVGLSGLASLLGSSEAATQAASTGNFRREASTGNFRKESKAEKSRSGSPEKARSGSANAPRFMQGTSRSLAFNLAVGATREGGNKTRFRSIESRRQRQAVASNLKKKQKIRGADIPFRWVEGVEVDGQKDEDDHNDINQGSRTPNNNDRNTNSNHRNTCRSSPLKSSLEYVPKMLNPEELKSAGPMVKHRKFKPEQAAEEAIPEVLKCVTDDESGDSKCVSYEDALRAYHAFAEGKKSGRQRNLNYRDVNKGEVTAPRNVLDNAKSFMANYYVQNQELYGESWDANDNHHGNGNNDVNNYGSIQYGNNYGSTSENESENFHMHQHTQHSTHSDTENYGTSRVRFVAPTVSAPGAEGVPQPFESQDYRRGSATRPEIHLNLNRRELNLNQMDYNRPEINLNLNTPATKEILEEIYKSDGGNNDSCEVDEVGNHGNERRRLTFPSEAERFSTDERLIQPEDVLSAAGVVPLSGIFEGVHESGKAGLTREMGNVNKIQNFNSDEVHKKNNQSKNNNNCNNKSNNKSSKPDSDSSNISSNGNPRRITPVLHTINPFEKKLMMEKARLKTNQGTQLVEKLLADGGEAAAAVRRFMAARKLLKSSQGGGHGSGQGCSVTDSLAHGGGQSSVTDSCVSSNSGCGASSRGRGRSSAARREVLPTRSLGENR